MLSAWCAVGALVSQEPPTAPDALSNALGHEDAGRYAEAAIAYRIVLARALAGADEADQIALALLGLERVWFTAGMRDSLSPVLAEVLHVRPGDPVARGIQFRALSSVAREGELKAAFTEWQRAVPDDPAPWREYIRTLMSIGRPLAADSAIADARQALGERSQLTGEVAQLAATLHRWQDAAIAWRTAVTQMPWMEMAAVFSLQPTPEAARDSVRTVLEADPVVLLPRRVLSTLETRWGDPRRGWTALAAVRSSDSVLTAWTEFGEGAEAAGAWSVALDVWSALFRRTGNPSTGRRAAQAALSAGQPERALELVEQAGASLDVGERVSQLLLVEVTALGSLGRAEEAAARVRAAEGHMDATLRADVSRPMVTAWLRVGNVDRARETAERAGTLDDDATVGWLALYDGDLNAARRRLVRASSRDAALPDALAVLARVRADRHAGLGLAFLALARGDSADATRRFATLADSLPEAAPALLATAARVATATDNGGDAQRYWIQIVEGYGDAPEVPEALLELARAAARRDEMTQAVIYFEKLLIEYSGSAMAPQARRELERLRGRIPEAR